MRVDRAELVSPPESRVARYRVMQSFVIRETFCEPEVNEIKVQSFRVEQKIVWLHVPVDDVPLVDPLQDADHLVPDQSRILNF